MNLQKTVVLLGWILVVLIVVGCTSIRSTITVSPYIATLSTNTIVPEASLSSTSSPSPSPIVIPTNIPPLSEEQARVKLLELLSHNGDCQLPCLWGITPGKSSLEEAWAILTPLSNISGFTNLSPNVGNIEPNYIEDELKIFTSVSFLTDTDKNVVKNIHFEARQEKVINKNNETKFFDIFDSPSFGKRAHPYMLSQVLSAQGIPTVVMISTFNSSILRGNTINGGFDILLMYPNQGLLVHYTTQMSVVGEKVRGCPANAHVELELYPSGNKDSFSEFLSQTQSKWAKLWPVPSDNPSWKTVENATSISLEQFYETFRQPTDKCIETPAKIWPPTEQ
jgi:hypothetical protein